MQVRSSSVPRCIWPPQRSQRGQAVGGVVFAMTSSEGSRSGMTVPIAPYRVGARPLSRDLLLIVRLEHWTDLGKLLSKCGEVAEEQRARQPLSQAAPRWAGYG